MALALGWLAGCADSDGGSGFPPGEPRYVLEALQPGILALAYGESANVEIVARDRAGDAVPGLEITFLLEGSSNDSGLSVVTAITDEDGVAGTTVTAGYSNALFRVRASTDEALPIFRQVAVSIGGFGSLAVTAGYPAPGARALDSFVLTLYFEAGCNDTRVVEAQPGERSIALPSGTDVGTFELLPASSTYAVTVTALYASGVPFAWGCVGEVTLNADETATLAVDAFDLPLVAAGEYDATFRFADADHAQALAAAATEGGAAAIAAAGGDASYLLDVLTLWLDDPDAALAFFMARDAAMDADLAADLAAASLGPTAALAYASEAIASEAASIGVLGALNVLPPEAIGERTSFAPSALAFTPDGLEAITLLLAQAGIDVAASMTTAFEPLDAGATATIAVDLSSVEIARGALLAAAARGGSASIGAHLGEAAGCAVLAANDAVITAAADPMIDCDPACLESTCEAALEALVEAMEADIVVNASYAGVSAEGAIAFEDPNEDLEADAIVSILDFTLTGGAATLDVSGSFDGVRAALPATP